MATPEPYPYRKLNYPINNLEQSFTQAQKLQTRSNIGIPSSADEEGKVLMVDNAAGELVWAEAPNGLPDIASGDEGKFLSVENGEPAWAGIDFPEQVNADWTETDTTDASYIKHKPTVKPVVAGDNITITEGADSFVISADGSGTQVQADWTETDSEEPSYIQHKPDLSIYAETANLATVATTGSYDDLSDKPTIPQAQVNSDWNASGGVAEILNKPNLSTVATTGDYNDLSNRPSIPAAQVNADWTASGGVAEILHKPTLAAVATSGDYVDLSNTPSIPTATSDLTNDSGFITLSDVPAQVQSDWAESDTTEPAYIQNKPDLSVYATDAELTAGLATKQDTISDLATIRNGASKGATAVQPGDLATVATTGSYSDLFNKPSIPTVDQTYSAASTHAQSGTAVAQAIAAIPSSTYTAGDGIEIVNNEISVAYDSDTLEIQQQPPVTHTYDVDSIVDGMYGLYGVTPSDIINQLRTVSVTVHIPGNTFYNWYTGGQDAVVLFKTNDSDFTSSSTYCATPLSYTQDLSTNKYWLDEQDVVITTLVGNATCNYFSFGLPGSGQYLSNDTWHCDTPALADPVQFSYTSASGASALAVKNPLPASTVSDADKVLTVDSNGDPEWGTGGKTYTGTDGVVVDNVNDTVGLEAPVDIVAGPGIVIDNPDGNTLRVSTDENYEVELYKNSGVPNSNTNDVFTLTEPVTNFERIRVEFWNREFNQFRVTLEYYIIDSTTSTQFVASMDHSTSTSNIQRVNMMFSYNSVGNIVDKGHNLFYGNGGNHTSGNNRGLGIHRIVGIHRLANN